jgi:peptide deformylase
MRLIYYPNPKLLVKCIEAPTESPKDRARLVSKMWKIMRKNHGAGLAATQVGLNIRMFVWKQNEQDQAIWNPVLSCISGKIESREGCLSIPGVNVTIQRATSSILDGTGINGRPLKFIGDAITTRIWQHEIDHLNGKLIIDNMNLDDGNANKNVLRTLLKNVVTRQNKD